MEIFDQILAELAKQKDQGISSNITESLIEINKLDEHIANELKLCQDVSDSERTRSILIYLIVYSFGKYSKEVKEHPYIRSKINYINTICPLFVQKIIPTTIQYEFDGAEYKFSHITQIFFDGNLTKTLIKIINQNSELLSFESETLQNFDFILKKLIQEDIMSKTAYIKNILKRFEFSQEDKPLTFYEDIKLLLDTYLGSSNASTILHINNFFCDSYYILKDFLVTHNLATVKFSCYGKDYQFKYSMGTTQKLNSKLFQNALISFVKDNENTINTIKEQFPSVENSENESKEIQELNHNLAQHIVSYYLERLINLYINKYGINITEAKYKDSIPAETKLYSINKIYRKSDIGYKFLRPPYSVDLNNKLCAILLERIKSHKLAYDSEFINQIYSSKEYGKLKFDMLIFMETYHDALHNYIFKNVNQVPFTQLFFGFYSFNNRRKLEKYKHKFNSPVNKDLLFGAVSLYLEKLAKDLKINKSEIPKSVLDPNAVYNFFEKINAPEFAWTDYDNIINSTFSVNIDSISFCNQEDIYDGTINGDNEGSLNHAYSFDSKEYANIIKQLDDIFEKLQKSYDTSKKDNPNDLIIFSAAQKPYYRLILTFYYYDYFKNFFIPDTINPADNNFQNAIEEKIHQKIYIPDSKNLFFVNDFYKYLENKTVYSDKKRNNNHALHIYHYIQTTCFNLEVAISSMFFKNKTKHLEILKQAEKSNNTAVIKVLNGNSLEEGYQIKDIRLELDRIAYDIMVTTQSSELHKILNSWALKNSIPDIIAESFEGWLISRSSDHIAYVTNPKEYKEKNKKYINKNNKFIFRQAPTYSTVSTTVSRVKTLITEIANQPAKKFNA